MAAHLFRLQLKVSSCHSERLATERSEGELCEESRPAEPTGGRRGPCPERASAAQDVLVVTIPTFRQDLKEEIDLIEEVARAYGYQNIPATLPTESADVGRPDPGLAFDDEVRGVLRGLGMTEVITSSLEDPALLTHMKLPAEDPRSQQVTLSNPKTVDRSVLRSTLLTSLLEVIAINQRHGVTDVSAFDLGVVFLPRGENELPAQPQHLALAGRGTRWHGFWNLGKGGEQWDFFALKGVLDQVLRGVARVEPEYAPEARPMLAVSQSARVSLHGEVIGFLGQLATRCGRNGTLPIRCSSPRSIWTWCVSTLSRSQASSR